MGRVLYGREALAELDRLVAHRREALCDALVAADELSARRAEIRKEQAQAYAGLARLRLDLVQAGTVSDTLGNIEASAGEMAERQAAFIRQESEALEAAAEDLRLKEEERRQLAEAADKGVEDYEARLAEIEAKLRQTPEYADLLSYAEQARTVNRRAVQKLGIARADREEKGKPYQQDPLFSYLWERGFRMPHYRAPPPIRLMDGWVAGLCGYDRACRNYQILMELPDRIAEHADLMARRADEAEARLGEAQVRAMADPDLEALKNEIAAIRELISACDAGIGAAEAYHAAMVERHEAALRREAGPAIEIRRRLEEALRQASFPDLRLLAAETVELHDDRMVDLLVRLRREEMSLDLEEERNAGRPAALKDELGLAEAMRRQFKEGRFDSPYVVFPRAGFEEVTGDLMHGKIDVRTALQRIGRMGRRADASRQADPDFGGRGRSQTSGLPDVLGGIVGTVLGEVLEEVLSETVGSRRSSAGSHRPKSPGRRTGASGPRVRSRKQGGGFRTGGGF